MTRPVLRLATEADLAEVTRLESALFGVDAWDVVALRAELDGPGRRFLVAVEVDNHLVGYAVSRSIGDVVDLQRIGVDRAHQRTGIAGDLLDDLLAHPGDADRMMLEVSADNSSAVAFYARRGFLEIARRPGYYRTGADALVLDRPLVTTEAGSARMEP